MPAMSGSDDHRKTVRHYDTPGHAHFLTFSCYQRLPLLSKDRTRHWLVEALEAARRKHCFDLWAWVIMPEHVHLLIRPNEYGYRTAAILSSLKKPVGYKAVCYLRERAPAFLERLTVVARGRVYHRFWQVGAGYDKNLCDERAVHAAVEYVHANPVRRGLVERAEAWRWSSAADWAGALDVPIRVDRTLPTVAFPV
jgi:putative transposase